MAKHDQPLNVNARVSGKFEISPDESEVETSARLGRSKPHRQLQHRREWGFVKGSVPDPFLEPLPDDELDAWG